MSRSSFTAAENAKITELVDEGVRIKGEVAALQDGLKDAVAAVAEELDVKPADLNAAINSAFKANAADVREKVDNIELLLHAAGRL